MALSVLTAPLAAQAAPQTFDSLHAAIAAVVAAIEAQDRAALLAIFGPENEDVASTGDAAQDRQIRGDFPQGYRQGSRRENIEGDRAVLHVRPEDWPFPAAVVSWGRRLVLRCRGCA